MEDTNTKFMETTKKIEDVNENIIVQLDTKIDESINEFHTQTNSSTELSNQMDYNYCKRFNNPDMIHVDNKENGRMQYIMSNNFNDLRFKKKISRCNNCGNCGHYYNRCMDPIISIGTLAFKVDGFDNLDTIFKDLILYNKNTMMKIKHTRGIDLNTKQFSRNYFGTSNNSECLQDNFYSNSNAGYIDIESKLKLFSKYLESIKFLMVRRKFTLGFIDFMKAQWEPKNVNYLIYIFSNMGKKEVDYILNNMEGDKWMNIFDLFWIRDGKINFDRKKEEFGRKFVELKNLPQWNVEYYCIDIALGNKKPHWGFCKGRRENSETNYQTAIRETSEESNNNVVLLENLQELKEDIIITKYDGTTSRLRNIYYLGLLNSNAKAEYNPDLLIAHKSEIGAIGFYTYMDGISLISPEHEEKKNALTQAYLFIASRLMKYEQQQIDEHRYNTYNKILNNKVTKIESNIGISTIELYNEVSALESSCTEISTIELRSEISKVELSTEISKFEPINELIIETPQQVLNNEFINTEPYDKKSNKFFVDECINDDYIKDKHLYNKLLYEESSSTDYLSDDLDNEILNNKCSKEKSFTI